MEATRNYAIVDTNERHVLILRDDGEHWSLHITTEEMLLKHTEDELLKPFLNDEGTEADLMAYAAALLKAPKGADTLFSSAAAEMQAQLSSTTGTLHDHTGVLAISSPTDNYDEVLGPRSAREVRVQE